MSIHASFASETCTFRCPRARWPRDAVERCRFVAPMRTRRREWSPPSIRAGKRRHAWRHGLRRRHECPAGTGSYVHWDRRVDGSSPGDVQHPVSQRRRDRRCGAGRAIAGIRRARRAPLGLRARISPSDQTAGRCGGGVTDGEPVSALVHFKPISTTMTAIPMTRPSAPRSIGIPSTAGRKWR